jgi:hypothetical protein
MVFPRFLTSALVVQEGLSFQKEIPPVLCNLEKTFQYQESLQLVLKRRMVLGLFPDYFHLYQLRFLSSPKPELFLSHSSSKSVLSGALLQVGCLPDHLFVLFALLAQLLEHFPVEVVL